MASYDLRRILANWPYESGQITVRKIMGEDGSPKIQMRLDLGLLQMEPTGRPDGARPFGFESLLSYHQHRVAEHVRKNGTELGFELSGEECQALREEVMMYYHRYLSLFVLEEFPGVERDTQRNIDVLDLCKRFAVEEDDRSALEQYRPYLIMMNTRAKAHGALERNALKTALAFVEAGLREITEFLDSQGVENISETDEVSILESLRMEILQRLPVDPVEALNQRLQHALSEEKYEEAALLRDEIAAMRRQRTRKSRRATSTKSRRRE